MNRYSSVTLAFCLACSLSELNAQSPNVLPTAPSTSPASNIVILNFNAAVLGTAEAQREMGALQKKYTPTQQRLQKLNDDIESAKKTLEGDTARLNEVDKTQRVRELDTKEKQFQREAEDFRNDSQAESQQVFQRIAQKVFLFLQEFSQQHGYSAVLERGTDAAPVVWYAASNVDITDQIIKGYDAKAGSAASNLPDKPAPSQASPANSPK